MTKEPSVQRTKREKRDHPIEPVPSGLSRRRFLTFLGTGSAALAAGSGGVLSGCAQGEEQGSKDQGSRNGASASTGDKAGGKPSPFQPIEPSDADELVLPEGFRYEIIRSSGDPLGGGLTYGGHNDYVAYFPIDALEGGEDSKEGILWVNHEYINPMFWSGYTDPEGQTKKTKEQIAREKAGVGGSVVRVRKQADSWHFVENDPMNRRIDATTPMDVTGPAAGSPEMKMEGKSEIIGTLANCGGGVTPWNTVLTCEENFQDYYGQRTDDQGQPGQGTDDAPEALEVAETYRWLDDPEGAQPPSTTVGSWRSTPSTRTPSRASIPGSDASGTRMPP